MRRNFRNPSSSSNNLNKIHLKFIRSYLPDIKIVLYAEVVLFYLELELFSSLCAILRVQKLRSAIIFFNSNHPLQRTYQTGELFKKYNLYRDIMTDILFYYFVKISKKKSPFFQWNHTCKIQR